MNLTLKSSVFILASLLCVTNAAFAEGQPSVLTIENSKGSLVDDYWTPERMKNAKPFPMPNLKNQTTHSIPSTYPNANAEPAQGDDGTPPLTELKPQFQQLFQPDPLTTQAATKDANSSFDRGNSNDDYSSSRLIPLSADLSYPYSTVGKLFFTTPQGNFVCSASVLRPRVILTAGHCVHRGSGGRAGFYSNFKFVPAFRDGAAPYRTWNWSYAIVTGTWATGNGNVPNAADYAMIESGDQVVNDQTRTLGSITGWLGWQTLSLNPNHTHLLGYPCNLDSCLKMHQVTAQSAKNTAPNNVEYGSDMRGGSSGGPWVQNFGAFAVGQTGAKNPGLNRIVGVTSYVYNDQAIKAEGSSVPDQRFINILNTICAHRPGNC